MACPVDQVSSIGLPIFLYNIVKPLCWIVIEEKTPFPQRDPREDKFYLSPEYMMFYHDVLRFARGISKGGKNKQTARIRYWAALALLRGVMSSPAAGLDMLQNRQSKRMDEEDFFEFLI